MPRLPPSPAMQALAATEVEKLQKEAGDAWDTHLGDWVGSDPNVDTLDAG